MILRVTDTDANRGTAWAGRTGLHRWCYRQRHLPPQLQHNPRRNGGAHDGSGADPPPKRPPPQEVTGCQSLVDPPRQHTQHEPWVDTGPMCTGTYTPAGEQAGSQGHRRAGYEPVPPTATPQGAARPPINGSKSKATSTLNSELARMPSPPEPQRPCTHTHQGTPGWGALERSPRVPPYSGHAVP